MTNINDVTAIIKTFNRPEQLLSLYKSIRCYYPSLNIVIVDDGNVNIDTAIFDVNVDYFKIEFDQGLSYGRNFGVDNVKTKFVLLLDDDFIFTSDTKLESMIDVLSKTDYSIVSGGVVDFGQSFRTFYGKMVSAHDNLYLLEGCSRGKFQNFVRYDFVLNFFMAKSNIFKYIKWDNDLKLGEHEDFFYRLKKMKFLVTDISKFVTIEHYPVLSDDYSEYRNRVYYYQKLSAEKNKLKKYVRVGYRNGLISKFKLNLKLYSPKLVVDLYTKIKGFCSC